MTSLAPASGVQELLDAPAHDARELRRSLRHVAAVNAWLGGRRALLRHVARELRSPPAGSTLRILDVGTGSADLPRAIAALAGRLRRDVAITALDRHRQIAAIAADESAGCQTVRIAVADAFALPFRDRTFDLVLLSMTLHHFEGDARVTALCELGRVGRAIIVGELERCWPAYLGARALAATVWRRNRLTRHDGPLSVRRAFTARELAALAARAGLRGARVSRHPLFRLVLSARSGPAGPGGPP